MRITFLGGADEVGGSGLLVELAGRRVLIDAGIRPSPKVRWGLAGDQLPHLSQIEAAGGLDAVLVTHAHTDHTGALELVAERFPGIPFYATPMTIALVRVLHQDSLRIMKSRQEEEGELPLFDEVAVSRLLSALTPVPFNTRLPLGEGLVATFYPAGHIAGAAMVGLHSDEGRLLVTGDVSISPQRTVDGAKPPPFRPDVLVMESTYGGRLHANRAVQERLLVQAVSEVTQAGGKVLIPAFALGRAQELLLILSEFRRRGELPGVPVWADGMVRAICQAYAGFADDLPLPLQERGAQFFDELTRPVTSNEQRNTLVWSTDPAVIVSSSGMLAGGPSQSYARALAGKPQHAILLTGYQDEESPGRRLQEMAQRGRGSLILGREGAGGSRVEVQCRLGTYSLSAHADEGQLVSLAEAVDAPTVVLVHGDEQARNSLAGALQARQRSVFLPTAGQTLEFQTALRRLAPARSPQPDRPLDIRRLWQETASPAGGLFLIDELARAWWGAVSPERLDALELALAGEGLYFLPDPQRAGLYRARTAGEVERALQRRARLADLPELPGRWLALRGPAASVTLARCLTAGAESLQVETEDGAVQPAWPEDILEVFGTELPPPAALARLAPGLAATAGPAVMEPNQALALANGSFPPEAGLRRAGYRLQEQVLVLMFEFPEVATERFKEQIEALQAGTGWQVEVSPETNQEALNRLARAVLPGGWQIVKGPSIYRESKRVVLTASAPPPTVLEPDIKALKESFRAASGYELDLALLPTAPAVPQTAQPMIPGEPGESGQRLEINAAYAAIRAALAGTSLYRTSLKGDEILLSFISPQVGERHRLAIDALARQTGWKLGINPQSNQGAILEAAREVLQAHGWTVLKGPSLHLERAQVAATLGAAPEPEARAAAEAEVLERTGYQLALSAPSASRPDAAPSAASLPAVSPSGQPQTPAELVEIPLERIRLTRHHQSLELSPEKLTKTIERLRRSGPAASPIRVRRLPAGYLLLDGLYRLRAAEQLGLERIWALVE